MGRGVKYWGGFAALLFVTSFLCVVFDALRAVSTQERFPMSWGDVCCSICLTVWVTHDTLIFCDHLFRAFSS